jgi:chromosome segregation ATPase
MWKDRVEHAKDVWALYPGQTAHLTVRCMNALYRLQAVRGEAMSQLMGLLEATKITLDNREKLVVGLSTEMVEKDLQMEQMATHIQELEELVGARENTIEVFEDQLINTQQQLEEANQHLDMHHQEIQDMEADEDVDIEEEWSQSLHPAWTLLAQGDPLPLSQALPRLLIRLQG